MTSAPSCSMSRRVSLIAVSAWSLEQPIPTTWRGGPLMAPPVQPSRGRFGFFGLAPANCDIAETTPARSWLSNDPNAPWQSDRTPILIGDLLPPVCCGTAGCGSGHWMFACSVFCFVVPLSDFEWEFDDESEPLDPHPAATSAAMETVTARHAGPPRTLLRFDMLLLSPRRSGTGLVTARCLMETMWSPARPRVAQATGVN